MSSPQERIISSVEQVVEKGETWPGKGGIDDLGEKVKGIDTMHLASSDDTQQAALQLASTAMWQLCQSIVLSQARLLDFLETEAFSLLIQIMARYLLERVEAQRYDYAGILMIFWKSYTTTWRELYEPKKHRRE